MQIKVCAGFKVESVGFITGSGATLEYLVEEQAEKAEWPQHTMQWELDCQCRVETGLGLGISVWKFDEATCQAIEFFYFGGWAGLDCQRHVNAAQGLSV